MKTLGVIPARFGSTRLPGKVLMELAGKPMIEHVYERAKRARSLEACVVATDDDKVREACIAFGCQVVMTSPAHPSGTDRVAEVVKAWPSVEAVVNIQADEPLLEPEAIDLVVEALFEDPSIPMATLVHPINDYQELIDPHIVKVVTDEQGFALYFSRATIPFSFDLTPEAPLPKGIYYRHIGLYAYKSSFILQLCKIPPSSLETTERLEQLRALQNGYKIKVKETSYTSIGVDTMEDLEKVRGLLEKKGS